MSIAAGLNLDRFGRDVSTGIGNVGPRYVVIDPTVQIIAAVVMAIIMGHDIVPTRVMRMMPVMIIMPKMNINAMVIVIIVTQVDTQSMAVPVSMVVMMMLRARKSRRP